MKQKMRRQKKLQLMNTSAQLERIQCDFCKKDGIQQIALFLEFENGYGTWDRFMFG